MLDKAPSTDTKPSPEQTLSAEVLSIKPDALPCRPDVSVASVGRGPDANSLAITLAAKNNKLTCTGEYKLKIRLSAPRIGATNDKAEAPAIDLTKELVLSIRAAPDVQFDSPPNPIDLAAASCVFCFRSDTSLDTDLFTIRPKSQIVDVQNGRVGVVSLSATLVPQGDTPGSAATAIKLEEVSGAGAAYAQWARVDRTRKAQVQLAVQTNSLAPGSYHFRLAIDATEKYGKDGETNGETRRIETPVLLKVRWGSFSVVLALLAGYAIGIGTAVTLDAGATRARDNNAKLGETVGVALLGNAPRRRPEGNIWAPIRQVLVLLVGGLSGLVANYRDQPTLGMNGVLDLLPALLWGATTLAVAKTLQAVPVGPPH